ncbi:2-phosphosulfolactate phosphatase [Robertmurraya andreesenii]|uniref:Probable 2-phosphosulfolactate phosphatase n=1 Tax=Anoxybacillus andreesenii TaxID=1325932 RepID=A0ABT9UZ15_9BACL|nr:2-phosphosulfolactate phosphatase [Robertmurraya andreesenii]MDQ0153936.1 2-phosphosulfolactate phosphatase [Robertmurraya andreesenii]
MTKVHLLVKKEDIDEEKIGEGNKIAVVLDVLLATTTITSALHDGASGVIPVMDAQEAMEISREHVQGSYLLAGEVQAKPIEGFVYPSPKVIRESISGKTLILSTTNGTVALRKSSRAKAVYVTCLLNNAYVADRVVRVAEEDDTILVICSGNSGQFSLEDFYGAGHFISCLLEGKRKAELSDGARAALLFYEGNRDRAYSILSASYVGKLFEQHDLQGELSFTCQIGSVPIIPILKGRKVVVESKVPHYRE